MRQIMIYNWEVRDKCLEEQRNISVARINNLSGKDQQWEKHRETMGRQR